MASKKTYTKQEVIEFASTLSTTDPAKFTETDYALIGEYIQTDGCTLVPDVYKEACIEHDFYYVTHRDFTGLFISRAEADRRLRITKQRLSKLGKTSPLSWWRWIGVRAFGWLFW